MEHEKKFIEAFILTKKRRRIKELLASDKRRSKVLDMLYHFNDLDPRFIKDIPPREQFYEYIYKILKDNGAPDMCYIISSDRDIDKKYLKLSYALKLIIASGEGTLIS